MLTCGTTAKGEFYARELAEEQTMPNLYAFGTRIREAEDNHLGPCAHCEEL